MKRSDEVCFELRDTSATLFQFRTVVMGFGNSYICSVPAIVSKMRDDDKEYVFRLRVRGGNKLCLEEPHSDVKKEVYSDVRRWRRGVGAPSVRGC